MIGRWRSFRSATLALLATVVLAGCQPSRTAPGNVFDPPAPAISSSSTMSPSPPPGIPGIMSVDEFRSLLIGKTWMSYEPRHGTQVTYIAADGSAFLWYPGNRVILPSRWAIVQQRQHFMYDHPELGRMQSMESTAVICFQYAGTSANPVTGNTSGLECANSSVWQRYHHDSRQGDVLGLSTMVTPPFPLSKDKSTLALLLRRTKSVQSKGQ